jgi:uncharacterized protein (DUF2062 family)
LDWLFIYPQNMMKNDSDGSTGGFGRWVPSKAFLSSHPWLKPIAHRVLDAQLWRAQHETLARGVAVGLFWAFAVPAGQVLVAAAHCVWWRANIPVAALMTMVTNPLTIGFWLWLAYQLGALMLGEPAKSDVTFSALPSEWIAAYIGPILLGMGTFAVCTSGLGYVLVKLVWRMKTVYKRSRRRAPVEMTR